MSKGQQDHYAVLGVSRDAPDEVIRAAYKALAAKYHPDRNPGDHHAELKLKRLNAAHRVLGDPEKRRQYDDLTWGPGDQHITSESPDKLSGDERDDEEDDEDDEPVRRTTYARPVEKPRSVLRTILRVILIVLGLGALGVGGIIWYVIDQEAKHKADQASVTITATYDPTDCPKPKYPIQVTIENSSSTRTVKKVTFDLEGYEEGRSDDVVTDGRFKESTRVVRPGVTKTTCWGLPSFNRATSNGVHFRANKDFVDFYDENDVIPPEPASTPSVP